MKRLCQQHRSFSSLLGSVAASGSLSRKVLARRMSNPEGSVDPFCQAKLALDDLIRRYNSQLSMCESVRRWRTLPTAPRRDPGDVQFTLMCYNILAQDLLEMHADLYDRHDSVALSWPHRYDRLMAEINLIRPDILCLQELQDDHREQFSNGLANFNYGVLYKKRTGDKPDGCAIFFRRDLFELVDHQDVEYYQPSVKLLDRENVALIAKLQVKGNPTQRLVVATTHLLYNPRRQDVRLAQIQVLLAELDRLAFCGRFANGTPKYTPSIVCGDFNLQPYSAPYMLMTTGYLQYDTLSAKTLEPNGPGSPLGRVLLPPSLGITDDCRHENTVDRTDQDDVRTTRLYNSQCRAPRPPQPDQPSEPFCQGTLRHHLKYASAYRHHIGEGNQEASTFQREWITVDYLFYSKHQHTGGKSFTESDLKLVSVYALPTVRQAREIYAIPNMYFGSDHFALAGRFLLKPAGSAVAAAAKPTSEESKL